jgi:hypothetical protein
MQVLGSRETKSRANGVARKGYFGDELGDEHRD